MIDEIQNRQNVLGRAIKIKRLQMGLSQDKLVEYTGVSQDKIKKIELGYLGYKENPQDFARIALTLRTTMQDLSQNVIRENIYLFHINRIKFFKMYLFLISSGFEVIETKKSCLGIIKHTNVLEFVERFYQDIESGKSPGEAIEFQSELCGDLEEFFIAAHLRPNFGGQFSNFINEIIVGAQEESKKYLA